MKPGKRRALARKNLRARCAVFNETDHGTSENAPVGWCEIQADQEARFFPSDAPAACAVSLAAGAEGTAMHYDENSGIFEPIDVMTAGLAPSPMAVGAAKHVSGEAPSWIAIVPRFVAKAAGLIRK